MITAKKWFNGARNFTADNPRYLEFIQTRKEVCMRETGMLPEYHRWHAMEKLKNAPSAAGGQSRD